jgi:S-adenosylmethionine:tRNA-ribosyltransferase-isomerase (queuine synthetase)
MWMGFEDSESGIAKYEVSLWNFSSCANESVAEEELQHDWIELTHKMFQIIKKIFDI